MFYPTPFFHHLSSQNKSSFTYAKLLLGGDFGTEELFKHDIHGKCLDIGTGETGLLANCLLGIGAKQVVATDIDEQAISWASQASNRSAEISWQHCDLFPEKLPRETYEFIVSNPPQMPMPRPGHFHDYGGPDGKIYIRRIIEQSRQLLTSSGKLFLLCFDFLGIDADDCENSISGIAQEFGMETRILSKHPRAIRVGGETAKNIGWIETIHPWYSFKKTSENVLSCDIVLLQISR